MTNTALTKLATSPAVKNIAKFLGSGVGLAGLTDAVFYKDKSVVPGVGEDPKANLDKHRIMELLLSTATAGAMPFVSGLGMKTLLSTLPAAKIMAGNINNKVKAEQHALENPVLPEAPSELSKYLLPAILGTGVMGYLGYNAYDRLKGKDPMQNSSGGNRDVALTIPGSKLSDQFFNRLSREMLFYTPEQKAQRIQELRGVV